MGFLALHSIAPMPELADQIVRLIVLAAVILTISRPVLDFRVTHLFASLAIVVGVFVLWIGHDLISPSYHRFWLFSNSITGDVHSSLSESSRIDPLILTLRSARAIVIVPIVEELFWRAWLMRWIIASDFRKV